MGLDTYRALFEGDDFDQGMAVVADETDSHNRVASIAAAALAVAALRIIVFTPSDVDDRHKACPRAGLRPDPEPPMTMGWFRIVGESILPPPGITTAKYDGPHQAAYH